MSLSGKPDSSTSGQELEVKPTGQARTLAQDPIHLSTVVNSRRTQSKDPAFFCFCILVLAIFLNLFLALLHARGVPLSNTLVTIIQIFATALAAPAIFTRAAQPRDAGFFAIGLILVCVISTNLLNPFDPKTIYDSVLIPVYIALGAYAGSVKPKWMHAMLTFVLAVSLLELLAPSIYASVVDPIGYLEATRGWVEEASAKVGSGVDSLNWATRAGGSQLGLSDRRIGGPFLEPLSLGYFGAVMSIYYAGLHRGSVVAKTLGLLTCIFLTLLADSRIPTLLVIVNSVFLLSRIKLPSLTLWLTFPIIFFLAFFLYATQANSIYSDTTMRLSWTFGVISQANIADVFSGSISQARANDSGIVYMLRCLTPPGILTAIWYYGGAFTRWRGSNTSFFIAVSLYLSVTLLFGGATLSIKTASLAGFLVGMAGVSGVSGPLRLSRRHRETVSSARSSKRPE